MNDLRASGRSLPPDIVITASDWHELREHLLRPVTDKRSSPDEQLAFMLASANCSPYRQRLLVHEIVKAGSDDLLMQGPAAIKPSPEFVMRALNRCLNENLHLIEVHSHPFSYGEGTTFSGIDWHADEGKMPGLAALVPEMMHVTMVMGRDSLDAHYYERDMKKIRHVKQITIVGTIPEIDNKQPVLRYIPTVGATTWNHNNGTTRKKDERYQRQEMVFGQQTQGRLHQSCVAIVGLGGLGSFVAHELAHMGIGHLILIDPDEVEETNLNRLLGAEPADVGKSKVAVYERIIHRIAPSTQVDALAVPIMDEDALARVKGADILVGCVDSHGARLILNQLAIRYLIPLIDGGSAFKKVKNNELLSPGGQVQVVVPGIGCLECRGFINPRRAAFDLAPRQEQEEERAHGYGTRETAPSVISLNGVIASAQATEVLLLLADTHVQIPTPVPPMGLYNAYGRSMLAVTFHASPTCPTCGDEGFLAVGDLAPIRPAISLASTSTPTDELPQNIAASQAAAMEEVQRIGTEVVEELVETVDPVVAGEQKTDEEQTEEVEKIDALGEDVEQLISEQSVDERQPTASKLDVKQPELEAHSNWLNGIWNWLKKGFRGSSH